jgi:hypothetical protein
VTPRVILLALELGKRRVDLMETPVTVLLGLSWEVCVKGKDFSFTVEVFQYILRHWHPVVLRPIFREEEVYKGLASNNMGTVGLRTNVMSVPLINPVAKLRSDDRNVNCKE